MNKTETQLIQIIKNIVEHDKSFIGDDCAVLDFNEDFYELISTDILIHGIHFDLDEIGFFNAGYKAMASNISDIAAMGGVPENAVVSLGIPVKYNSSDIEELYNGLMKSADEFSVSIVGGDISQSRNDFIINVCITGKVRKDKIVYRGGAKDKDLIYITGALGGSRLKKHYSFKPKVKEARFLAENNIAGSMIDISDGLSKDLREIMIQSNRCGAIIDEEKIPVFKDCVYSTRDDKIKKVFCDGEDFELLFTVNPGNKHKLENTEFNFTCIGYFDDKQNGIFLKNENGLELIDFKGFEHFTSS